MKRDFKKIFLMSSVIFLASWGTVIGQDKAAQQGDQVILYLHKGMKVRGTLISIIPGVNSTVLSIYGDTITIPESALRKVFYVQEDASNWSSVAKSYTFREKGFYHAVTAGLVLNTVNSSRGGLTGFELTAVFGHQRSLLFGYGIGIGADFYYPGANEMVFPIFGELRGYFTRRPVSPYYNIRVGHGLAFGDESLGLLDAQGGLMINPAIGWRLSGKKGMNIVIDLGVKFQRASFERLVWGEKAVSELVYRRLNLRLGLLF